MNYKRINAELAREFGKGQVEVRPPDRGIGEYVLWIKQDDAPRSLIRKAKHIVNKFMPTRWFDSLMYHIDE